MKPTLRHALLLALVCALVVFVLPAFADSQARIVRLSYLDGSVQIDRNTGDGFEKAIVNMPITQGVKLATQDDGEAEVEFEDGSTVRLAPRTRVSFDQLSLQSDGGKASMVSVEQGTAYFKVKHKDKDDFKVAFSGHEVDLRKNSHFRAEVRDRRVELAVFDGELRTQNPEGESKIKKKQTVSFNLDNSSDYTLAKGIDEGQYDWWDKERDKYQSQYSYKNNPTYASAGYGSPYYGWNDLAYYGNTFYLPGYGNVWRPYNVGYGWDPFSVGYWMYYPSWGYTWISPYPWGWTPYRYGGWYFAQGYGWVWRPTPGGFRTWNPRPPVVNAPSGYRPPAPPSNAGTGTVPTRPAPGRSVVAVGNPSDSSIPRWTARPVPGRDRQVGIRTGDPGARPGSRAITPAGTDGKGASATTKTATQDKQSPAQVKGDRGNRGDRGNSQARTAPSRVDTPRSAPSTTRATPPPSAPRATPPMSNPGSMGGARSAPSGGGGSHSGGGSGSRPPRS